MFKPTFYLCFFMFIIIYVYLCLYFIFVYLCFYCCVLGHSVSSYANALFENLDFLITIWEYNEIQCILGVIDNEVN